AVAKEVGGHLGTGGRPQAFSWAPSGHRVFFTTSDNDPVGTWKVGDAHPTEVRYPQSKTAGLGALIGIDNPGQLPPIAVLPAQAWTH
ncbi:MAG: hypothetical protein ACRD0J_18915, partial [Acidimicrobiales bacterium]